MGKFVTALVLVLSFCSCNRLHDIAEGKEEVISLNDPKDTYTVMLAGQSNMERIEWYASDTIKTAIIKRTGIKNVVLIPCSVGGTWSGQWLPGAGNLERCVEMAKGKNVDIIFYWQGESDAYNQITYWDKNFKKTVDGFRALLHKEIPIIYAQIGKATGDWLRGWKEIQKEQEGICLPNVKMIKTEDLIDVSQIQDEVHITSSMAIRIAKRFVRSIHGHGFRGER